MPFASSDIRCRISCEVKKHRPSVLTVQVLGCRKFVMLSMVALKPPRFGLHATKVKFNTQNELVYV